MRHRSPPPPPGSTAAHAGRFSRRHLMMGAGAGLAAASLPWPLRQAHAVAGPPLRFMKLMGFRSHSSFPSIRTLASSPWWRDSLRNVPPLRRASSSANQKPALCRVRAYSGPGLPRPTINLRATPDI